MYEQKNIVMKKTFKFNESQSFLHCVLFLSAVLGLFTAPVQAQRKTHLHPQAGDAMDMVVDEIKIVAASPDKAFKRENLARNRNFESFTIDDEKGQPQIFFVDRKTKKIYEIRGIPLEYRPFSDLVWLNDRTLAFDRWANPHHGSHYEIDAKARRLKKKLIFKD